MSAIEPHLKKFQKELSAGTVSLVLLSVLGQAPEPAEWLARFPRWQTDLRQLFEVHSEFRETADDLNTEVLQAVEVERGTGGIARERQGRQPP